ncbi:MAG: ribosomal protein S18-alanine N-acetyltransferase [Actinomycetota bacterium]|nr:ribosomal protein S18-alanine N-acetyltransferase [Actinomycetota bacterium]
MTAYRTATSADVGAIVAVEAQVFGKAAWSVESVRGELAGGRPTRHVVVAADGDRLVGYASLAVAGEVGDVQRLAVVSSRRRRGLAADLLRTLLDEAAARGCRRVLLEVGADNGAALALYRRFGFVEISRRPRYYPGDVDALVLALGLQQAV